MAEYLIQGDTLDDIADAINAKTGGSSAMTPAQMVTAIGTISGGSVLDAYLEYVNTYEYTQAEDWTTDALGSLQNFVSTYIKPICVPSSQLFFVLITNNEAGNFAFDGGLVLVNPSVENGSTMSNYSGVNYRANFSNRGLQVWTTTGVGRSVYITAGSNIKIVQYKIKREYAM